MPNVTIRKLPPVTLPIDAPDTFLEVSVLEAGKEVSRRIAADDLSSAFGLDATFVTVTANALLPNERILTAGTNISVVDGGAGGAITINNTAPAAPVTSVFGRIGVVLGVITDYQTVGLQFNDNINLVFGTGSDVVIDFDAANFVIAGVGNFNITGFTAIAAGTVDVDFDAITGTSYGGILEANLLDKAAAESVSGTWTFSGGSVFLTEQAAAEADVAGDGQVWVRNDAPNNLMFTDDVGTDFVIGGALGFPALNDLTDVNTGAVTTGGFLVREPTEYVLTVTTTLISGIFRHAGEIRASTFDAYRFLDENPSATNPVICARVSDFDTGIGSRVVDELSFICGGVEIIRLVESTDDYAQFQTPYLMLERAAAIPDIATFGQVWVRNDAPNTLMFTDDVGTDFIVGGAISAAYTRNATIVEDRTLLASASATTLNNNNVLAALIADLQTRGILG